MPKDYSYPLDLSWTAKEIATVVAFFAEVENYYETSVNPDKFIKAYQAFKKIVPSKAEEKRIDREFESLSGYSIYSAVQKVVKSKKKV